MMITVEKSQYMNQIQHHSLAGLTQLKMCAFKLTLFTGPAQSSPSSLSLVQHDTAGGGRLSRGLGTRLAVPYES